MSRSLNRVTLIGNLGKDAEETFTQSGVSKTTFSLATSRRWKDQSGEWKEETDWHRVIAWRKEHLTQYLFKGTKLYVEGRLQTRSYEKDGAKQYVTEVVAEEIILLGGGDQHGSRNAERFRDDVPDDNDTSF